MGIKSFFRKIGKAFKEIPKIGKKIGGGFSKMGSGFRKMTDFIKKIVKKIKEIELVFKCISNVFESIESYINCFFDKIISIPYCFIYYLLKISYNIGFSLPYAVIVYFIPQIAFVLDMIYDLFMYIDDMIYKNADFHIFDFQEGTKDKCFRCKNLKPFPNFKKLKSCGKKNKDRTKYVKCPT